MGCHDFPGREINTNSTSGVCHESPNESPHNKARHHGVMGVGYTPGCPGCQAVQEGTSGRLAARHATKIWKTISPSQRRRLIKPPSEPQMPWRELQKLLAVAQCSRTCEFTHLSAAKHNQQQELPLLRMVNVHVRSFGGPIGQFSFVQIGKQLPDAAFHLHRMRE